MHEWQIDPEENPPEADRMGGRTVRNTVEANNEPSLRTLTR